MKYVFSVLAVALVFSCSEPPRHTIPLEKIESLYAQMKADGINTDTNMLYGYFFTNDEPTQLEKLAGELQQLNFDLVDIYQNDDEIYWLHVERIETHTAQSLFELNKKMYQLADKYKISSYDGFDLGNADKTQPIKRNPGNNPPEI